METCCHRETHPGWDKLVTELELALKTYDGKIVCLKTKFGALRCYVEYPDDTPEDIRKEIRATISSFEGRSLRICEECGEPGVTINTGYWLWTLCPRDTAHKFRKRCDDHVQRIQTLEAEKESLQAELKLTRLNLQATEAERARYFVGLTGVLGIDYEPTNHIAELALKHK